MTPFGAYLEKLRKSRKLGQKELAYGVGVNASYISSLETGRKAPPQHNILDKLIQILKLTKQEQETLKEKVELTQLTRRIPNEISEDEFIVIHELWKNLGFLKSEQITIILNTLKLGNHIVNKRNISM